MFTRVNSSFVASGSTVVWKLLKALVLIAASSFCLSSQASEVALAGVAYSGDHASIQSRFPYSKKLEAEVGKGGINAIVRSALASVQPTGYTLISGHNELKGRDQVISVALVVTNETVSVENLGHAHKLFAQVRGQALFFDFKTQTILRAYPFSFAYLDARSTFPTEKEKVEAIRAVYMGANDKPGIIGRFGQALLNASLPSHVPKFVQVTNVIVAEEAKKQFPPGYANGAAETWVADTFSEALSSRVGVPVLPFSKGYAIGNVMSMTVADGTVYSLKLPKPDYEITLDLTNLRKILYEERPAGQSFIYGSYLAVKLEEPMSGHRYLDAQFKNGEVKVVPSTQSFTDDFPAFQDSILGLEAKLMTAIVGDNGSWLKSAGTGERLDKQIFYTRELLQSCK